MLMQDKVDDIYTAIGCEMLNPLVFGAALSPNSDNIGAIEFIYLFIIIIMFIRLVSLFRNLVAKPVTARVLVIPSLRRD